MWATCEPWFDLTVAPRPREPRNAGSATRASIPRLIRARIRRVGVSLARSVGHTGAMGFNPHQKTDKTPADFLIVIAALVVCAGLVVWGIFG